MSAHDAHDDTPAALIQLIDEAIQPLLLLRIELVRELELERQSKNPPPAKGMRVLAPGRYLQLVR
jgi:hypothetical protein